MNRDIVTSPINESLDVSKAHEAALLAPIAETSGEIDELKRKMTNFSILGAKATFKELEQWIMEAVQEEEERRLHEMEPARKKKQRTVEEAFVAISGGFTKGRW